MPWKISILTNIPCAQTYHAHIECRDVHVFFTFKLIRKINKVFGFYISIFYLTKSLYDESTYIKKGKFGARRRFSRDIFYLSFYVCHKKYRFSRNLPYPHRMSTQIFDIENIRKIGKAFGMHISIFYLLTKLFYQESTFLSRV